MLCFSLSIPLSKRTYFLVCVVGRVSRAVLVSLHVSARGTHMSWNDAFMSEGLRLGGCGHAPSRKASHRRPLKRARCGRDPGQTCRYRSQLYKVPTEARAKHKSFQSMKRNILAISNSFPLNVFAVECFQILKVFYYVCRSKNVLNSQTETFTARPKQPLRKARPLFSTLVFLSCLVNEGFWYAVPSFFFNRERIKHTSFAALKTDLVSFFFIRAFQLPEMHESVSVFQTAAFWTREQNQRKYFSKAHILAVRTHSLCKHGADFTGGS